MKHMITSRLSKYGRSLVVVSLVVVALALLLGIGEGWRAAEAQALALTNVDSPDLSPSNITMLATKLFLPRVAKSNVVFFDDFSNSTSGWPHRKSFEDCYFEYRDGHYRVEIDSNGQRCIIPNFAVPKQVTGTFSVLVRRTSSEDRKMLYGLIFGAGVDATEDRWTLEIYPNDDSDCSDKPFYWLYALVDGDEKFFEDGCTDSIDKDEDDWNEIKIIRTTNNGDNQIRVYINGLLKGDFEDNDGRLINEGYTLLEVVSLSDDNITVEFDDFRILRTTTP